MPNTFSNIGTKSKVILPINHRHRYTESVTKWIKYFLLHLQIFEDDFQPDHAILLLIWGLKFQFSNVPAYWSQKSPLLSIIQREPKKCFHKKVCLFLSSRQGFRSTRVVGWALINAYFTMDIPDLAKNPRDFHNFRTSFASVVGNKTDPCPPKGYNPK